MERQPATILEALLAHAAARPAAPCLTWQGQALSYAELLGRAAGWAAHLRAAGLSRGDRAALYLGSSPTFLAAYLGAQLAGAAVVLINTQYRSAELSHILSDAEPRLAISDAEGAGQLAALPAAPPVVRADQAEPPPADPAAFAPPAPADLALLAYTSGTTGRAKGAAHSHAGLAANGRAVVAAWEWTSADRLLLALPLFHIHGLGVGVHGTLLAGASLDLRPRFEPAEVLAALASGEHSMFFGVPTMYTRLIAERRAPGAELRPAPLRLFVSGSAPLSPQTFGEWQELFGQPILERYGMTETGMNLTNPYRGERRPGTVGGPFPGQEARVVGVQSRAPLPDGEVGEIQVRGPHVCTGYWRNPAATAEVFGPDGWFSTGDLGWRSADGYFTITGRARELIISGGYNIYPREVEEQLLAHPAVAECAVLGLPDPDFGEQVAAAVVLRPGVAPPTPAELADFCRAHMAAYKRPRRVVFVDSIPRNAMGKPQKHILREQLAS